MNRAMRYFDVHDRRAPRHRTCRLCGERPARFRYRGAVRADRAHELCFECFRAIRNQVMARALSPHATCECCLRGGRG